MLQMFQAVKQERDAEVQLLIGSCPVEAVQPQVSIAFHEIFQKAFYVG